MIKIRSTKPKSIFRDITQVKFIEDEKDFYWLLDLFGDELDEESIMELKLINSCTPYVYQLEYPNGKPFYIGKGTGNRGWKHAEDAARSKKKYNKLRHQIIRDLKRDGSHHHVTVLKTFKTDKDALLYEQELIKKIGTLRENTGPLTN